jgi:exosortase
MTRTRQAYIVLTAAALALCYASTLRGMFEQWSIDEDMSHGFVVPIVVLWIVWRERGRWQALPAEPSGWGLALLAAGAGMQILAAFGGGLFAASVAFLVSVAGAVLYLGGFVYLRAWAFPFLLALFMLPKLAIVYSQVTFPLQLLASRIAAAMLGAVGVAVVREGNILDVAGHRVSVQEACNGVRYLLTLAFIAVVYAYLADAKPWMRFALLAVVAPIAIFANALRVAASGLVPALDAGTPHAVAGYLVFVLCVAILILMRGLFHAVYARYHA